VISSRLMLLGSNKCLRCGYPINQFPSLAPTSLRLVGGEFRDVELKSLDGTHRLFAFARSQRSIISPQRASIRRVFQTTIEKAQVATKRATTT
jgi:hypothetical protein